MHIDRKWHHWDARESVVYETQWRGSNAVRRKTSVVHGDCTRNWKMRGKSVVRTVVEFKVLCLKEMGIVRVHLDVRG